MRVLVIGAGVGGLAVANGLIRHGHQVQVFEHAEQLRTGGAGLTIWSNGTRALRELGVDIEPLGRVLTSLRAMTETGRFLWEADLAAVTAELGSPTVQIPRERLIAALAEPLAAGVVQFGKRCVRVTEHPDHVVAHFDDGSTATGDLVIGADGVRSVVRRAIDPAIIAAPVRM